MVCFDVTIIVYSWFARCEAMDQHARYQRAMRALEAVAKIGGGHFKRQGMTKTIMRVDSFLDLSKIQDQLSKPCWVGKDRHACLDLFAENPQLEPQLQWLVLCTTATTFNTWSNLSGQELAVFVGRPA